MLEDIIARLEASDPASGFDGPLRSIARHYSLRNITYLALRAPGRACAAQPLFASTYSSAWQNHYAASRYHEIDPIIQRAPDSVLPLDWNRIDKRDRSLRKMFGEAREFGVGDNGLSLWVRGCRGELAVLSVTSDFSDSDWRKFTGEKSGELQLLALHINQKMMASHPSANKLLSKREAECLSWASRGKTFADIGVILGLSERTVRFHLDAARSKLDSVTLTQAVAKAISMQLIPAAI